MEWTEEDFRDAARLLAVLEQRSKNRRAGRLGPVALEIADQLLSPTDKRADGASDGVQVTLKRRPQLTATREEGEVGSGSVKGGGHAAKSFEESFRSNGCACPDAPDFAVGTDRTNGHALEDW